MVEEGASLTGSHSGRSDGLRQSRRPALRFESCDKKGGSANGKKGMWMMVTGRLRNDQGCVDPVGGWDRNGRRPLGRTPASVVTTNKGAKIASSKLASAG